MRWWSCFRMLTTPTWFLTPCLRRTSGARSRPAMSLRARRPQTADIARPRCRACPAPPPISAAPRFRRAGRRSSTRGSRPSAPLPLRPRPAGLLPPRDARRLVPMPMPACRCSARPARWAPALGSTIRAAPRLAEPVSAPARGPCPPTPLPRSPPCGPALLGTHAVSIARRTYTALHRPALYATRFLLPSSPCLSLPCTLHALRFTYAAP